MNKAILYALSEIIRSHGMSPRRFCTREMIISYRTIRSIGAMDRASLADIRLANIRGPRCSTKQNLHYEIQNSNRQLLV